MAGKYRLTDFNPLDFKGQFILTSENRDSPQGWITNEKCGWLLYSLSLPVLDIYNQQGNWLGWCIGHPIIDGKVDPTQVKLNTIKSSLDMAAVDDFYNRAAGKWALLLVEPKIGKIFLDPYGSLSTVFSTTEKTIASTTTLLGTSYEWNEELLQAVGLPETSEWLPSGLTSKKNIQRLMPNHSLDLAEWKVWRHWPTTETDMSINPDTEGAVKMIADSIRNTIAAVSNAYPTCFSLTAGRDSRMVLASARNFLNTSTFFTFVSDVDSPDREISLLLAKRFQLNHKFLKIEDATPDELEQWLLLTGMSVSGSIWKIHKTIKKLDPERVLLPGMAGEVGRAFYWRRTDKMGGIIRANDVLKRCGLPQNAVFLAATDTWLSELSFLDIFALLDFIYIEQRLGCWAAPQHYGNTTSAFEIMVFGTRPIFHAMMRLPHDYRQAQKLPVDICRYAWPELLEFPFNEFAGIKGQTHKIKGLFKKVLNKIIRR